MEQLLAGLGGFEALGNHGPSSKPQDSKEPDTSEIIYISSLALIKMLKHGRAGIPMEVMGLMLGEFVDEYTVKVIDVFAMPQSGTGVTVEAVDPVYQMKMLEMLKQTGRPETVVGWYHSHPGFGCWLSSVDLNTQKSFEALSERAVAVVIDPIQSVKGKVVIDAFRSMNPKTFMLNKKPRETTSNLGHLEGPSKVALRNGLNTLYYSIQIAYQCSENEKQMLLNLNKHGWMDPLTLQKYADHRAENEQSMGQLVKFAKLYNKSLTEENKTTDKLEASISSTAVGKTDPKRHLNDAVNRMLANNLVQNMGAMINVEAFQVGDKMRKQSKKKKNGKDKENSSVIKNEVENDDEMDVDDEEDSDSSSDFDSSAQCGVA